MKSVKNKLNLYFLNEGKVSLNKIYSATPT